MNLGTLEFLPPIEHPELLALPVMQRLKELMSAHEVGVSEIDPSLSDTAAFCEKYQIKTEQAANCVILEAKRGQEKFFAACVVLANTRADINGLVRRTLDAKKVSFAAMGAAVTNTCMEFGAITPIGLPLNWTILVDKAVANSSRVIIGSGLRKSKLLVPGNFFTLLPNVQIVESLAIVKV